MPEVGRIYQGDCIEVMRSWPDDFVDMIWTDPPYGHGNHEDDLNSRLNEHRGIEDKPIANDSPDEMRRVVDGMLHEAVRVLKPDCCCCCCCGGGGPRPTFAWLANRMDADGMAFFHSVIWDKINPGLGWRYKRQHEMVMVAHRKGGKLAWNEETEPFGNILRHAKPHDGNHPNEKPLKLVQRFIAAHTKPGDLIVDPFCGSGTTLVAAEALGRRWIGIELDPVYVAVAQARVESERAQGKLF